jgi:hypothetical protein
MRSVPCGTYRAGIVVVLVVIVSIVPAVSIAIPAAVLPPPPVVAVPPSQMATSIPIIARARKACTYTMLLSPKIRQELYEKTNETDVCDD